MSLFSKFRSAINKLQRKAINKTFSTTVNQPRYVSDFRQTVLVHLFCTTLISLLILHLLTFI